MASEFASHVGMAGKCICRICEVYRKVEDPTNKSAVPSHANEGADTAGDGSMEAKRVHQFMTVRLRLQIGQSYKVCGLIRCSIIRLVNHVQRNTLCKTCASRKSACFVVRQVLLAKWEHRQAPRTSIFSTSSIRSRSKRTNCARMGNRPGALCLGRSTLQTAYATCARPCLTVYSILCFRFQVRLCYIHRKLHFQMTHH